MDDVKKIFYIAVLTGNIAMLFTLFLFSKINKELVTSFFVSANTVIITALLVFLIFLVVIVVRKMREVRRRLKK